MTQPEATIPIQEAPVPPTETAPAGDGGGNDRFSERGLMVVLVPLMLVLFIATLDQTIVATAIPSIADALGHRSSSSWKIGRAHV